MRDNPERPSYMEQALRKPEFARRFLQAAGIIDETRELAPRYRDSDGVELT